MDIEAPVTHQPSVRGYPAPVTSTVLASGAVAVVIGLAIVVSWHARFESILQLSPGYPPMAYNTALTLAFSGLAVLLLCAGRFGLARVVALSGAGASLLTFAQYLFSVDLGIDRLLFDPYSLNGTASHGRMAPQTAAGLLTVGLALALATRRQPTRYRSFILAIAGSLVIAVGAVALVGYLTSFEQAYGWGRFARMSPQAATGFLALGIGLFALGWGEARAAAAHTPRWLFAPITIGVAVVSILFCQALLNHEDRQIDFAVRAEAAAVQHEVESELAASVAVVDRIGSRWERSGRPSQTRWQDDIGLNFDSPILFEAIEWVDPFYQAR